MLSKFFIDRPIFASVISIIILIFGGLAISSLPIEKTPDITPPTVTVSAFYPGANADVIAKTVAVPLEEQINGVEGMLYMSSNSSDSGRMNIKVTFEIGTDIDMATVLVQNRVSRAESSLPEDVIRNGITVQKSLAGFVLLVNIMSPDNTKDRLYLSNYTSLNIKDVISRIEGVGNVVVFGQQDFSMRVWLDPAKLKSKKLTTTDVVNVIREQNMQVAAGQVGTPPTSEGLNFQYTIKTQGRLVEPEEFGNIVIKVEDGKTLKLKDVARVELGASNYAVEAKLDGNQECVVIAVSQLSGSNALDISEEVHVVMNQLKKNFPAGVDYSITYDTTNYIIASIKEVVLTLFIAVALVVLTIFVFLENFRATLIPTITIPVSLIGTFGVMNIMGISINSISLFGLVLVIGIVVDDTIVVVENTMRLMQSEKLLPKPAAKKAMDQITGAVIATTLVLLAVFVPTMMIGGVSGRLYTQFALTISIATVFSTINALTLSPALCGLLLKPIDHKKKQNLFFRGFNAIFEKATNGYMFCVGGLVRKGFICMILFAGIAAATAFGFKNLPTGFLPDEDEGVFFVGVKLPDGASKERTDAVMAKVSEILNSTDGVSGFIAVNGYSIMDGVPMSNSAVLFTTLDDWSMRKDKSLLVTNITQQVQGRLFGIQEAMCFAFSPPPIMGLGFTSGFELQLQDKGGVGYDALEKAGQQLMFAGMQDSVITGINSSFRANVPQYTLDVDRLKAKTMKVPLSNIYHALQTFMGGLYVNDFNLFGRTFKVYAQAEAADRDNIEDVLKLEVRNEMGQMVPLSALVKYRESVGPQNISHFNIYPSTKITGQALPGFSSGQAMDRIEELCKENLPPSISYEWSGMSFQEKVAGSKTFFIFAMGAVFAFLFLAANYESWSVPVAIVLTVPIALFGAVGFTWLRGYDNNTYTQIGIVLLIGQATKTAILLVEFAKQEHDRGVSVIDSAINAARLRFRPILMTALSFVFGVLPLVIATGAGAVSRKCLGTGVFGGMAMATVMGIFLMPVFYVVVQNFTEKAIAIEHKIEDKIHHGTDSTKK